MNNLGVELAIDNEKGKIRYSLTHSCDAAPVLERASELRKKEEHLLNRASEIRPQASLDPVTVMRLEKEHGINVFRLNKDTEALMWKVLQRDYPKCLTTNRKVHRPIRRQRTAGVVIPRECLAPDLS